MGHDLLGNSIGKNICQRTDGTYCGRYINKHGIRKSVYGSTVKIVQERLQNALEQDKQFKECLEFITVDSCFELWIDNVKRPILRECTYTLYRKLYNIFLHEFRNDMIYDVYPENVQQIVKSALDEGCDTWTVHALYNLLYSLFTYISDNYAIPNPARNLHIPGNCKSLVYTLQLDEQQSFREAAMGTFYYNMFITGLELGLRPTELFGLTVEDIDFESNTVSVHRLLKYTKCAGDDKRSFHFTALARPEHKRKLVMSPLCKNVMQEQLKLHYVITQRKLKTNTGFNNLLFTTKFGTPLNTQMCTDAINRIIAEINVTKDLCEQIHKCDSHTLRYSYIYKLFMDNTPIGKIQELAGNNFITSIDDLCTSSRYL